MSPRYLMGNHRVRPAEVRTGEAGTDLAQRAEEEDGAEAKGDRKKSAWQRDSLPPQSAQVGIRSQSIRQTASLCEEKTLGPEAEGTQAGPSAMDEPRDPGHTLHLSNHISAVKEGNEQCYSVHGRIK